MNHDIKRSLRRYHKNRMRARARKIYPRDPKAFHLADNIKNCSCMGCGNPRHHYKGAHRLTLQERRANLEVGEAGQGDVQGAADFRHRMPDEASHT
jgi:hypothetical protein